MREILNLEKEHTLYLVVIKTKEEEFCKVGVTTIDVDDRMSYIECNNCSYIIIKEVKCNGYQARAFESLLLTKSLDYSMKYKPKLRFGGYTECYKLEYLDEIIKVYNYLEKRLKRINKNKKEIKNEEYNNLINKNNVLIEEIKHQIRINRHFNSLTQELEYQKEVNKTLKNIIILLEKDDVIDFGNINSWKNIFEE